MLRIKFKKAKESWIFYAFDKIVLAIIVALIVFVLTTWIINNQEKSINTFRNNLQGFWVVQTITERSDYDPYVGLNLYYLLSVNIDKNFQIYGNGLKFKENDQLISREQRTMARLMGSIVQKDVFLNIELNDPSTKLPSMLVLSGNLENEFITGSFKHDVANSEGKYCAVKIAKNFSFDNIPTSICD